MSTAARFRCDGCGKEAENNAFWAHVTRHTIAGNVCLTVALGDANVDYCPDCWRVMSDALTAVRRASNAVAGHAPGEALVFDTAPLPGQGTTFTVMPNGQD
jgi:hypothetical protein